LNQLQELNWDSDHGGICLMADLLTASGGQLVFESGTTLTVQFDGPEKAVNAARRLQRALHAFADGSDTAGFAASIVIHKPEDKVRQRPALSVNDMLGSDFAAPGQILLSASAHEVLQFTPGMQFRFVTPDNDSFGSPYQELLWIDSGVLEDWQARVVAASQVTSPPDHAKESDLTVPEVEASAEGSPVQNSEDQNVLEFDAHTSGSDTPGRRTGLWVAACLAILALVGTIGFVLHMKSNKTTKAGMPQKPKIAVQLTAHDQESQNPSHASEGQQAVEEPKPEPPKPPAPAAKPHRARETDIGLEEYEGFTVKQVPQLIRKAEDDAGAGDYDAAKREYGIVLKLQPNNTAAKEGLYKLSLKVSEHR
jgi:hypothetical protein